MANRYFVTSAQLSMLNVFFEMVRVETDQIDTGEKFRSIMKKIIINQGIGYSNSDNILDDVEKILGLKIFKK